MRAVFETDKVSVTLTGLATLEGGIVDGNSFEGTKATLMDTDTDTVGSQFAGGLGGDSRRL